MIKPIKFDLKLSNGETIATLDDLKNNLTIELFEHFHSGKLAKWLRVRKLDELADKMEALLSAEKEHQVQLFKSLCEVFVGEISEENARETIANYKATFTVENSNDDEIEQLQAENEELRKEIEKHKSEVSKDVINTEQLKKQFAVFIRPDKKFYGYSRATVTEINFKVSDLVCYGQTLLKANLGGRLVEINSPLFGTLLEFNVKIGDYINNNTIVATVLPLSNK